MPSEIITLLKFRLIVFYLKYPPPLTTSKTQISLIKKHIFFLKSFKLNEFVRCTSNS